MKNLREISASTSKSPICFIFLQQIKLERKRKRTLNQSNKENTEVNKRQSEGQWFPRNRLGRRCLKAALIRTLSKKKKRVFSRYTDGNKVNLSSNQAWTSDRFINVFTSYQTYKQINLIVTACVSLCDHYTRQVDFSLSRPEVQKGSVNISVEEKFKTLLSFIVEPHSPTSIQI